MEDLEKGQHQVWIQVGSELTPKFPIRDDTGAYCHFEKLLGILLIFSQGGITQLNTLLD